MNHLWVNVSAGKEKIGHNSSYKMSGTGFLMTYTCAITKDSNKNKNVHLTRVNTL